MRACFPAREFDSFAYLTWVEKKPKASRTHDEATLKARYYLPLVVDMNDFAATSKIVRRAEELGYYGIGIGEHYSSPGESNGRPDPFVVLSMLVPTTSRIHLGTMASSATVRHPAVLANTALSLDALSGGRSFLCLGVGSGAETEYSSHGFRFITKPERLDAFEEALKIISGLSRDRKGFSYRGRFYTLNGSTLNLSDAFPQIWVGERKSRRLLELAGRYADVINIHCANPAQAQAKLEIAREAAARAGRDREAVTPVLKHFVVMAGDEDSLVDELERSDGRKEGESKEEFVERMRRESPEAIIGTADEVQDEYEKYAEAGFSEFSPIILPNSVGRIAERMEIFARRVA
ncbi:MAG: LLM class flavin-dependent oxidoreductase [Nitrososphaerota archaeon]|jgi:alkanesulfonate monooxygenase SsuD/methylene tetrahydromethanopterin reductase-like flavin-dependent oxidoreductase (luciferase family)|nr:LLM class flavin-dependent oxidoreductase [Nitrososphaerota archaeon]MDG6982654.1 LLM class flavin-dependent oxidoreductase [Nitrososphaerota archaeon]